MIDPFAPGMGVIRTEEDRQVFLIFCILAANARTDKAWPATQLFMSVIAEKHPDQSLPFDIINHMTLPEVYLELQRTRVGQYSVKSRGVKEAANAFSSPSIPGKLEWVYPEQLEQIHGIGPKTARFFILYTQPDADVVPLDTHILKFLRDRGYDAPKSTPPSGPRYRKLEQNFIGEAYSRNQTPQEFDFHVWKEYRAKRKVA